MGSRPSLLSPQPLIGYLLQARCHGSHREVEEVACSPGHPGQENGNTEIKEPQTSPIQVLLRGIRQGFKRQCGLLWLDACDWFTGTTQRCRGPAWGIPPVTRSCRRKSDKMQGCDQASGVPPGISWACTPKTKNLPAFVFCFSTLLIFSGKSQIRALVFCIWKGCFS